MRPFKISWIICLSLALIVDPVSSQCTVCADGSQISLPDKMLTVPGYPPQSCSFVDASLMFLLPNETSPECGMVQSLGSICGCSVPEDSCSLCPNGNTVKRPENELPFLADLFLGFVPTCELAQAYLLSTSKSEDDLCSSSQIYMSDYCGCNEEEDNVFLEFDEPSEEPCLLCPDGASPSLPSSTIDAPNVPFQTCNQLEQALALLLGQGSEQCSLLSSTFAYYCGCNMPDTSCSLCRDGSPAVWPERTVAVLRESFGGLEPTCSLVESVVASYDVASDDCANAQLLGSMCGCPARERHCQICDGESIPLSFYDTPIPQMEPFVGVLPTCEDATYIQLQLDRDDIVCHGAKFGSHLCGCNDGVYSYLDADTTPKQATLSWMPRVSALFSFIGSLCIILDVMREKKRRKDLYRQLVMGMSIFDLVGSIAWGFSSMPQPTGFAFGDFYGAFGTTKTCTLQGFALQLNYTSMFYNVSLSTYYMLVIAHGWRNQKLLRNRFWFHGTPLLFGIGLAFGGIPFYESTAVVCTVSFPPYEDTWLPIIFFTFVPIFLAIALTTAMMIRVYVHVRKQNAKASKWKFERFVRKSVLLRKMNVQGEEDTNNENQEQTETPSRLRQQASSNSTQATAAGNKRNGPATAAGRMEREFFIQSILFLSAFYLSWTFLLAAVLKSSRTLEHQLVGVFHSGGDYTVSEEEHHVDLYPLYLVCFTLAPLQGFWNAVVYFRPRLNKARAARNSRLSQANSSALPHSKQAVSGRSSIEISDAQTTTSGGTCDPSVALAGFDSGLLSPSNNNIGGTHNAALDNVKEELEQLEDAHLHVEEYREDE